MTVRVEIDAGIARVTLDAPARRNALSAEMKDRLIATFQGFAEDDRVRAVILTGANNAFSSGADVTSFGASDIRGGRRRLASAHALIRAMVHLEKPIIAAVRGPAVGIGWSLALASDYILATPTAKFGQLFRNVGLAPDGGAAFLLAQYVGVLRAKELVMSARIVTGEEAMRLNLLTELVAEDQLDQRASAIATDLAASAGLALGMAKRLFVGTAGVGIDAFLELESHVQNQLLASRDHKEGAAAFVAKRPPKFEGR
ncbi:enoyl-CoA hydratase/isomerase family protein [Diaphorobacter nitroreducens]|uniref:enoyl-CoA hydratase/isomerase family protein n=1 Tax=Diaphorobacter nitroreducens TaxID=164759 RepID=UPI00289F622D|nr:enoyl-CoA hydratase-related protein [Diaphorobacter nitroreducens]